MERQKFPPPVSTKITRKLASQSTEHNSLLNFYSSISTDETGAPKRWKMSSNVQIDEGFISSGKTSPVPTKNTSRDNSSERKGRPGPKKGWKDKESTDNASSRDSSLDGKEKNKGNIEMKRESLSETSKGKKIDDQVSRSKSLDKVKFNRSTRKANGNPQSKRKIRPKSLDLSPKLTNGEEDSFKSPDPLTPCNIAVKRKKGRPKETPPTLVAETPVEVPESSAEIHVSLPIDIPQPTFESAEIDADVEDNIEPVIGKKRKRKPKLKDKTPDNIPKHVIDKATNEIEGEIPKRKLKTELKTVHKVLGQKKGLKGPRLMSKLKGTNTLKRPKQLGSSKTLDVKAQQSNVVKKKVGRPPGAKNKATILKEQLMAKLIENKQSKEHGKDQDNSVSQTHLLDTPVSDSDINTIQTCNDNVEKLSDLNMLNTHNSHTENPGVSIPSLKDEIFTGNEVVDKHLAGSDSIHIFESKNKKSQKTKVKKTLGVKKGGIKSSGKLKKEEDGNKKVRKKRILNSYASNGQIGSSLDHLPKNDLRRYLQMKLIERLSGNRSINPSLLKPFPDKVEKSEKEDDCSEEDSISETDPVKDIDIQNLSALVEQKRIRSESDASEQRRSASRSRKSSVDLSKISDNESISSEISVNSISSAKRIFVLGEDNGDTDDSIRTRQRVEIVPGKSRKRTLSGEFDLVDESQLRREKKMARISGSELSSSKNDINDKAQVTPLVSPVQMKKKTSPKLVAIKQKLDAQREKTLPFVSQLRKRLLKQSPFLTRMRRKKKRKPENRGLSPIKNKEICNNSIESMDSPVLQEIEQKSEIKISQEDEQVTNFLDFISHDKKNEVASPNDIKVAIEQNEMLEDNKINVDVDLNVDRDQKVDIPNDETVIVNDKIEMGSFDIETEVHEIISALISKVVALNEPVTKEEHSSDLIEMDKATFTEDTSLPYVPKVRTGTIKRRKGRPKKVKRVFPGQKRLFPVVPVEGTTTQPVKTGAKRGRKPRSKKVTETSELNSVRTFQLRQKISRSPLDNIALKQSIEESEYIKSEVQRANKKEAKLLKSKRPQVVPVEQFSVIPPEPAPSFVDYGLNQTTETATESEISDDEYDTLYEPKTMEDLFKECKPCSVVVTDFFKQLQRAQQHVVDDESTTETEDFGEDSIDNSDYQPFVGNEFNVDKIEESEKKTPKVLPDSVKDSDKNETEKVLSGQKTEQTKTEESPNKKEMKMQSTFSSSQIVQELQSITPKSVKTKSPPSKKKSSPKTYKSTPEHQTARKTVPPLKIKLKGGIRKTYMVESTIGGQDNDNGLASLHKPVKKKKSKSSSKSGSDSDRGSKAHHHHHHKKRNKSPLVGQVGVFPEKKSKPTAIVAASPSIKPNPIPKDPYEATFLEFIQNKEKDLIRAPTPTPVKVRPLYDLSKFKEMSGNMTLAASSQSIPIASVASFTENQSQVSLYNSISKNTSLVNSFINDNLKKTISPDGSSTLITNEEKKGPLFIGVVGTKSNVNYFCSHCVNEVHKTDDLVLKHFATVHPGAPVMYRRVAETQPNELSEPNNIFDRMSHVTSHVTPNDSSKEDDIKDTRAMVNDTNVESQNPIQKQNSTTNQTNQDDQSKQSNPKSEEGNESDSGSLNLKIVEVVSLKDQINAIDVEETTQQKETSVSVEEATVNNRVLSPELKIPQFPRSTSSSVPVPGQLGLVTKAPHHREQILQTYPSNKPLQRKTPGLITPGKFCNTFKCEKCNVHAPVLGAMVAHLRNAHTDIPRLFQCPYCRDIEAETEALIHQHIRQKHPTDNLNPPVALSEKAKSNLRTLSVRVPDSKANDTSFLEKDIYMCLNCKVHMPSLEAIYDHLEMVHNEVFVFVCSACKVFKSKTENEVLQHYQTDPVCSKREKNISLAIDGSQFTRVPCLIKEKTKNKNIPQPNAPQQPSPVSNVKQPHSQLNTTTKANSIVQALQKQSLTPSQLLQHGLNMQQFFQQQFGPMIAPTVIPQPPKGSVVQQTPMIRGPVVLSQPPTVMSPPVLVSPPAVVPQSTLASHPAIPPSFIIQTSPVPSQTPLISPATLTKTLPSASQQAVFPHPTFVASISTPSTSALSSSSHVTSTLNKNPTVTSSSIVSSISTFTSPSASTPYASSTSVLQPSSISSTSGVTTSFSIKPSVSSAPVKPTGAKKRKNLLESIQHIKMQKQREQQAKMETESVSDIDYLSAKSESPLGPLSSNPSPVPSDSVTNNPNSSAPPPLIRGPPPLIRFDQLNQVPLSAAVPMQSDGVPQQAVKQVSTPLQMSKSDITKPTIPPRQIQSSLFDTSDPNSFKPVQRTPVLNVPSVTRANRSPATQLSSPKPNQLKPSTTPLDLSRTTPTNSPAPSPPVHDTPPTQNKPDTSNQDVYSVFNLKPSTQAQLPKEALQNRAGIHQLPPKVPIPPQTVRPNAANTIAYRPQHPHVSTTQVPQVINMPLGMLNNMGNIVVSMPSFQVVQGMPGQFMRMAGTQLLTSPGSQGPVNVSVAMPTAPVTRPALATQPSTFQPPINETFKCPYCPKVVPLTFAQVKPHIEAHHPGCSVMLKRIESQ